MKEEFEFEAFDEQPFFFETEEEDEYKVEALRGY